MEVVRFQYFDTPFGELILGDFNDQLCLCDWRYREKRNQIDSRIIDCLDAGFVEEKTDLIELTKKQLTEYFKQERKEFDIPILTLGAPFQKEVWAKLLEIPYGETRSYLELAEDLGNPKAVRAVAAANGANAISIIIPCHRIIGADGELVGYAGGIATKKKLLELEGSLTGGNQIQLF